MAPDVNGALVECADHPCRSMCRLLQSRGPFVRCTGSTTNEESSHGIRQKVTVLPSDAKDGVPTRRVLAGVLESGRRSVSSVPIRHQATDNMRRREKKNKEKQLKAPVIATGSILRRRMVGMARSHVGLHVGLHVGIHVTSMCVCVGVVSVLDNSCSGVVE